MDSSWSPGLSPQLLVLARALVRAAAGERKMRRGYGAPRGRNGAQALMLAYMLWRQVEQLPYKPPVTLALIALQAYVYVQSPLSPEQACLAPLRELRRGLLAPESLGRLLASPVHHADDAHIYYNSASFLAKGVTLEARYGSARFGAVLLLLTALTQAVYVVLCAALGVGECGVGFSGVIFALKILCSVDDPGSSVVGGFTVCVPSRDAIERGYTRAARLRPRPRPPARSQARTHAQANAHEHAHSSTHCDTRLPATPPRPGRQSSRRGPSSC